jgi:membrane-bound serine protease (ClpP class)
MNAIDGRSVARTSGALVLHTAGANIEDFPMPYWQVFLNALIDPTVAALLFLLAAYGIITELTSPGAILPGVVGGIAAILAIVSLANLPVDIAGALLMFLALVLFLADLKANTHGILSFGGVLSLILGMAFLINTGPVGLGVNPVVIFGSAAITFAFFVFFVDRVIRSRRRQVLTGADALVGAVGHAREDLLPEGLVFVRGALWKATAIRGPIPAGSPVQVVGRNGLQLEVVAGAAEVKENE